MSKFLFGKEVHDTRNGPVRDVETMRELINFVSLGPIHGEMEWREGGHSRKSQVVVLGVEAKKTDEMSDLETTRQKALRFIQQVAGHRDLQNAEEFLRQKGKIAFTDGALLKTQDLKIIRKEG